jgi:solute carrier family 25 (mitochondrial carnitine/acylcarnitine transporter), member 20/29
MILIDYFAGVAGGIAVVLVGHPFDTTKTRLQTSPRGYYSSSLDCVSKTFKHEGFAGFYKGLMSPLAGQMFFRAASFSTFYSSVTFLSSNASSSSSPSGQRPDKYPILLLSGSITGFVISFIEAPIDLVKTKLQIQIFSSHTIAPHERKYTGVVSCARYIARTHGARALWQGWTATCIRNIPANALFFPGKLNLFRSHKHIYTNDSMYGIPLL